MQQLKSPSFSSGLPDSLSTSFVMKIKVLLRAHWKLVLDYRPVVGFLIPNECRDELLVLVLVLSAEDATVHFCASEMACPNMPIKHTLTFTFRHLMACSTCSARCLRVYLTTMSQCSVELSTHIVIQS